jgi:hypothetical protein
MPRRKRKRLAPNLSLELVKKKIPQLRNLPFGQRFIDDLSNASLR